MGILPCHLSCHRDDESQSGSSHLHSESSTSSISSQPSLPSVPSLTSSSSQRLEQTPTIHQKCIATLKGNSYVFSLALSGKILYSGSSNGSADKKIKVWRKHAGENKHLLVETLEKHKSAVNALALSDDGTILYSGACDRSILVWERENSVKEGGDRHMVLVGALRGHNKAILCLAVVADLICSGSANRTVRIWRRGIDKSYSCLTLLEGHRKPVE
ncbi:hypothetical protein COLO4_29489 [Corchorus olitorius]|uniref:Uncharacterized protein n=1 Tax=Corchorus olitorius TaxID=93759 RepID=A0A1R3HEF8_9ROSI|nr:hypothetical protein COLO4_29489 [Corchorus olitorius]